MISRVRRILFVFIALLSLSRPISAQTPEEIWQRVDKMPQGRLATAAWIQPTKFHPFNVNHTQLAIALGRVGRESSHQRLTPETEISLPMPDGTFARFRIVESPVMAPELAAEFPEIKTYRGVGVDDPQATCRLDVTPQGFHAQILSPSGAVYVDPYWRGDNVLHTSYYKRDCPRAADGWVCYARGSDANGVSTQSVGADLGIQSSGGTLRIYRLAVAATGEYTAFQGGTVALGQAAIVTAVNRVTGVYENDFAIRLVLVANNSNLVYTNSGTDPYTNNNPSSLLTQNQSNIDSVIGTANYDIGHVFSTAGGGLAALGVVCEAGFKSQGETGTSSPTGDGFWIDYVAHEMGHQFGANHPFNGANGSCTGGNRNASTAYEPGSGSTIMAYAGICGIDDLQPHSDPYFHSISYEEIMAYVTNSGTCSANTGTGNSPPTVSVGANYTIPSRTPFILTATGSDPDGDALTYCWEERDLGAAQTVTNADNGSSPIFRSFNPTTSPSRTFPRIEDILGGTNSIGEKLPTTSRTMKFKVTVRDNRANGGGVNASGTNGITVVSTAGPFRVTFPVGPTNLSGNATVTWNVANTTLSPISSANVNILLSTNGGLAFTTMLASNTPNDGSEIVTLPNLSNTTARIKLEATGNIFFNISSNNFTVLPSSSAPVIVTNDAAIAAESCVMSNGVIDPGETVTVSFGLKNAGTTNTSNLVATLLATNGVASPSSPQTYGNIGTNATASQSFSFTATGSCGGSLTAMLQLQDGTNSYGTVVYSFTLGQLAAVLSQNFDGATVPALPAGWSTAATGGQSNWVTSTAASDTVSNAAFSADIAAIGDNELDSPSVSITSTSAVLSFRHSYSFAANSNAGYDGGVLEIKIGAGSFTDILATGGLFTSGGYNSTLTNAFSNPLAGRAAWSGSSGSFISTVVNLPASAAGQNIQMRWRAAAGSNTPPVSSSGTLAYWSFDSLTPTPDTMASNVSFTPVTTNNLSSGATFTYFGGNPGSGSAIAASGFPTSSGPPTASYGCFAFSMVVTNGSQADLSSISLDTRRSNTGPANFSVQVSLQANFSSVIFDSGVKTAGTSFATATMTLTNSGLTGTVYFRIYGYAAGGSAGTLRVDNLTVQGSITSGGTVGSGWYVDTISISDPVCCVAPTNSPPVINAANVSPASPTTTNELLAVVTSATDADSNPISFTYQWQESSTNLTGQTASNLLAAVTFAGGSYRVIITPNDGLTNGAPFPTSAVLVPVDVDGNGINDDWEIAYFGSLGINPNNDSDGDGLSDLQEYQAGTNPTNAVSTLAITSITVTGGDLLVSWLAAYGKSYAVQTNSPNSSDFTTNFSDLSPAIVITGVPGTGETVTNYLDAGGATNIPSRYYRIRLLP